MTDTCRLLTYVAAWKYDIGRPIEREAAVAKLMASELANQVAYKASHLHRGYGFMDDSPVARHYRGRRILTIGEARLRCSGCPSPGVSGSPFDSSGSWQGLLTESVS